METAIGVLVSQFKAYAGRDGSSDTLSRDEFQKLVKSELSSFVKVGEEQLRCNDYLCDCFVKSDLICLISHFSHKRLRFCNGSSQVRWLISSWTWNITIYWSGINTNLIFKWLFYVLGKNVYLSQLKKWSFYFWPSNIFMNDFLSTSLCRFILIQTHCKVFLHEGHVYAAPVSQSDVRSEFD